MRVQYLAFEQFDQHSQLYYLPEIDKAISFAIQMLQSHNNLDSLPKVENSPIRIG